MLKQLKHGCVLLPKAMEALGAYDFQGAGALPQELTLTS
jgi:hypothetical protein